MNVYVQCRIKTIINLITIILIINKLNVILENVFHLNLPSMILTRKYFDTTGI